MRKHEAKLLARRGRAGGRHDGDEGPRHGHRHAGGAEVTEAGADIVPTVEANGNDPISPLSVAAEPALCLSK